MHFYMRQSAIRNIYKIKAVLFLLLRSCSQNVCETTREGYGQSDPGQYCLSSHCYKKTFKVFECSQSTVIIIPNI